MEVFDCLIGVTVPRDEFISWGFRKSILNKTDIDSLCPDTKESWRFCYSSILHYYDQQRRRYDFPDYLNGFDPSSQLIIVSKEPGSSGLWSEQIIFGFLIQRCFSSNERVNLDQITNSMEETKRFFWTIWPTQAEHIKPIKIRPRF